MKTFTIGGMKFYGNPDSPSSIYSYAADGSQDSWIPSNYFILDEESYKKIREIQSAEIEIFPSAPTYQSELAELNRAYQADTESYKQAYSLAFLADGPQEQAKQAAIRDLYTARKALHAANLASLKAKYSGSTPS